MKNEEILKKAIEKAVNNGWINNPIHWDSRSEEYRGDWKFMFDHDFAKAFWGDADFRTIHDEDGNRKVWEHHLMLMVLEEDPILYLKDFI